MAAPSTPSSGKKKLLLLSPFIILGVLILAMRLPINIGKSGSDNSTVLPNNGLSTKFSPEELAVMANKNSVDYVAGECATRKFVEFQENWTFSDKNKSVYCYYYGKEITNEHKYHYGDDNYDRRINEMIERVTPNPELGYVNYTLKNKQDYDAFKEYIKGRSTSTITDNKRLCDYPHYILNNAVFIDYDYRRSFNGYCYDIYPLSKFNSIVDTANNDTAAKTKELLAEQNNGSYNDKLAGLWKGIYNDKKILLAILQINHDTVYGYSSLNGNFATCTGIISSGNSGYTITLKEPAGKLNGIFTLSFDSTENTISGKWSCYDCSLSGNVNLSRAVYGDTVKVVADKAYLFSEHEYKSQRKAYFIEGDVLQFDSLSTIFVHCTNTSTGYNGWLLVKKIAFQ